jgi:hypothetical protein
MELLAETTVEVCWHVFSELNDNADIIETAVVDASVLGTRCEWTSSLGPHTSERLTVVQ